MQRMDGPEPLGEAELRAADRWITDMLTSVFTSREIPVNTVLGSCDLKHSSLYDSIAFIALKCSDRRTKPYMLKVDVTRSASESPCWLQLVQPARNADEQNLEAYVKDGQLFFRTLRTVKRDSELLVWYKKDLSQLLNLSPEEFKAGTPPFMCPFCKQTFQFEFPLLAHQRFLCKERFLSLTADRLSKVSPHSKADKPATDFHNLARDLENDRAPSNSTEKGGHSKRKHSEVEKESRDKILSFSPPRGDPSAKRVCVQGRPDQLRIPVPLRQTSSSKTSAISIITTESNSGSQESPDGKNIIGSGGLKQLKPKPKSGLIKGLLPLSRSAACSIGDSISSGDEERKSAFVQPPRSSFQTHSVVMTLPAGLPQLPLAASKLQSAALLQAATRKQLFGVTSPVWPKPLAPSSGLVKTTGSSTAHAHSLLSVPLSPIAPLGLPAQNWCAKCSISFHMTSDLVHHMRSHHKRAPSEEQGAKLQRRDRLRCPICKESFRERHHLSRHMTSHT